MMKYFTYSVHGSEQKYPFLFPVFFTHKSISDKVKSQLELQFAHVTITSAGLFNGPDGCYGFSESLMMRSKPEDTALIQKFLNFRGNDKMQNFCKPERH
jgi:hypothetical protein